MLGNSNVCPVVAVSDMTVATKFYGDTLGLEATLETPAGTFFKSGNSGVFVYPNPAVAGTDQATHLSWTVDDVPAMVEALKAKGVTFEQYDGLPGVTREGDVHTFEGNDGKDQAAWLKDPDGNILSFGTMSAM